jgi:hypothetical protein
MLYLNTLRLLGEMCLFYNIPSAVVFTFFLLLFSFSQIQIFILNTWFHFKPLYMPSRGNETLNFASFSHSIKERLDF